MSAGARRYDVAVVGAGVAGSMAAARLSEAGCEVLLLERTGFDRPRCGEFLTSYAAAAMERSGLLEAAWRDAHSDAAEFISTWGGGRSVRNFISDPYGSRVVLDRNAFDRSLASAARARGAELRPEARFRSARRSEGCWSLAFDEGDRPCVAAASFLVICCGRNGPRVRSLEVRRRYSDRLVCFGMRIAQYQGDVRPAVEGYGYGWAYSVGLPGGALMVNLFTEHDPHSVRRLANSYEFLIDDISKCPIAGARVLDARPKDAAGVERFVADASSVWSRPAVGPGWCLAGDCAQSMDPLSSSGISQAAEHAVLVADELLERGVSADALLEDYAADLDRSYMRYLRDRAGVYGKEPRWRTSFWERRRAAAELSDAN